jgi:hypothetical protein
MNIASTIDIGHNESNKMLGLQWNSKLDQLKYVIHKVHHNERVTKRRVLSSISKIYDPLGLLGPVITRAKLIMQLLWQLNFHWDESIPEYLYTLWLEFQNKLDHLNNIKVPRHITCNEPHHIELHGFSDASEKAYGACIFIKSRASQNHCHVRLLCAKSG